MASNLTHDDEQLLLNSVKTAVALVDDQQLSPNDAIIKLATDQKLQPGYVRSVVSAFNTGRQMAQWNRGQTVLDKLASFPLADYDTIHAALWGKAAEKQAAVVISDEYNAPPSWVNRDRNLYLQRLDLSPLLSPALEKSASETTDESLRRCRTQLERAERDYQQKSAEYSRLYDNVQSSCRNLINYIKQSGPKTAPLPSIKVASEAYFGAHGKALMDYVEPQIPGHKEASARVPFAVGSKPMALVQTAIQNSRQLVAVKQARDDAYDRMETLREQLQKFGQEKLASWIGGATVAGGTQALLDKYLGSQGQDKAVDKAQMELEDPDHENELRKIRTQTMLNELLTDPDNPVSGYDPYEVLETYNQLSQLAPRVAEQPAAVQPLLAKRLAGRMEPFEVKEISDIEKGLKDSKQISTGLISNAPNSIFG